MWPVGLQTRCRIGIQVSSIIEPKTIAASCPGLRNETGEVAVRFGHKRHLCQDLAGRVLNFNVHPAAQGGPHAEMNASVGLNFRAHRQPAVRSWVCGGVGHRSLQGSGERPGGLEANSNDLARGRPTPRWSAWWDTRLYEMRTTKNKQLQEVSGKPEPSHATVPLQSWVGPDWVPSPIGGWPIRMVP